MAIYEGKLFRIKIGAKTIFHETNFSFSSSLDFKELASKDTATKEKTPSSQNWSISCESLAGVSTGNAQEDIKSLYEKHKNKSKVTISFTLGKTGDVVFTGEAYVGSFSLDSANDEEVKGAFTFEGTGDLSIGTVV